ncbi:hypothetical protein [Granulicella sibirica]|uniref:hypothetical protein n=1 Tax=Granulicella sibirica TaxID=2479048 RepID=UPI001008FF96|nr:hypothetical protein [Granulicella sibirica]
MNVAGTQSVDYNRLAQRLAIHACLFLRFLAVDAETRVIDGIGKSATDFAADTILLFVDGQVTCEGDEEAVFACLRRVMERDILDVKRLKTVRTVSKVEPISGSASKDGTLLVGLDDFASKDDVGGTVEDSIYKQHLYQLLEKDEPELFELVFAVCDMNALTPKEIAEAIGTTPSDVQNRKKRLRTFVAKNTLLRTTLKASV